MDNLKSITIEEMLDQVSKKTSYDLIYVSYLRDIINNLLDNKKLALDMSGDSKKAYEQAYDDILKCAYKFIATKFYIFD